MQYRILVDSSNSTLPGGKKYACYYVYVYYVVTCRVMRKAGRLTFVGFDEVREALYASKKLLKSITHPFPLIRRPAGVSIYVCYTAVGVLYCCTRYYLLVRRCVVI